MSQAATSGLVRVTVASGSRRVDLALPGSVPLAELVPELARSVGLLDPATAHGGHRVRTADGRPLSLDVGLTLQGVDDGQILYVHAGVEEPPPRYDDVAEAMADIVEEHFTPAAPQTGVRTAVVATGLLLLLSAVALSLQRGSVTAAVTAVGMAAILAGTATALSRGRGEHSAAVVAAWLGATYAAVAGLVLAPDDASLLGLPLALAGVGAVLVGLLCLLALREYRMLALPLAVVGALAVATGLVGTEFGTAATWLLMTGLVVVVVSGSAFPWLALSLTGLQGATSEPGPIDLDRVAGDARLAHEILLAITLTVGVVLVLAAPVAVATGVAGTLLVVAAALVVMLRARQYRSGAEVLTAVGTGVVTLVVAGAAAVVLHPDWRMPLAAVLAVVGVIVLFALLVPGISSVRRGRWGDAAETVALIALLPLLVLALGVVDALLG